MLKLILLSILFFTNLLEPYQNPFKQTRTAKPSNHPKLLSNKFKQPLDSLPPLDTLLLSIKNHYQLETQKELLQLATTQKGEWLKYLPSIGINYALTQKSDGSINTTPRPTLSYNSGKLYTAQKDKNTLRQKRQDIILQYQLLANQDQQKVTELYHQYQFQTKTLKYDQQLLEIDEQLFQIKEAKYELGEILPLEYLMAKKSYLTQQRAWLEKQQVLKELKWQILSIAKTSMMIILD